VAPEQSPGPVEAFVDGLAIDMPVLVDGPVPLDPVYFIDEAFLTAAYPKNWLIGPDGQFVYADNRYEPDELIWRIEELLGEGSASAVR
jgi:hypothetical protein